MDMVAFPNSIQKRLVWGLWKLCLWGARGSKL
jgi:hypothetical protein